MERAASWRGISIITLSPETMRQVSSRNASSRPSRQSANTLRASSNFATSSSELFGRKGVQLASSLGLVVVTTHAGFLPEDEDDPDHGKLVDRLRRIAGLFSTFGIRLGLETGQEDAATLTRFLQVLDRPHVGVNFDPANMILYDMDEPTEALAALIPHVLQFHVKDALRTTRPGTWGEEVVAGTGQVRWEDFFRLVREEAPDHALVIEREAGESGSRTCGTRWR